MLPFIFDEVDEAKLLQLCEAGASESSTLDFKRELPTRDDKGKHEFLKDICAFANADGGDIVFGIAQERNTIRIAPILGEDADAAARRLGQILDAGLEPRLQGVRIRAVPTSAGYVLTVRVPASFNGPHRFFANQHAKFVMRNGTHTVELTYEQLRSAFDRTATLAERTRQMRENRINAIIAKNTWKPMPQGPLCVVHVIPIAGMAGRQLIDISTVFHDYSQFMFSGWGGASRQANLDGVVIHPAVSQDGMVPAYVQVFRSGAIEAIRYAGSLVDPTRKIIPSATVTDYVRDAISRLLKAVRSFGMVGPALASASLLSVGGYGFGVGIDGSNEIRFADRLHLVLPEIWIDDIDTARVADIVAKPILDVLWQSFGFDRCPDYREDGAWMPRP